MSKYHEKQLRAINRAHERVSKVVRELNDNLDGKIVQLKVSIREWHGGSRHPPGRRFVVDRAFIGDRDAPYLWLRRADKKYPSMGAELHQVEFLEVSAVPMELKREPPIKLTKARAAGLRRISKGEPWAGGGIRSRTGGAIRRMFDWMKRDGLVDGPPFEITQFGADCLDAYEKAQNARLKR